MQVSERIYLVGSGKWGFNLTDDYDCHVYLLDGGTELALIDVGAGMGVPQIVENIRAHGFDPQRVRHILLTHGHADHAGGAAKMAAALDHPRVYMHSDSAPFLRAGDERGISLDVAKRAGGYPSAYTFEPCAVDVELREEQRVRVGSLELNVIETPGHSQGHVSFTMRDDGRTFLFGGDLIFFGGKILLQNTWDCNLQAHLKSLLKLRDAKIDVLLPAHLTFSLKNGQRHIDAALKYVDELLVPPQFI